jgi:ABC-type glutathione transport system ATPase component
MTLLEIKDLKVTYAARRRRAAGFTALNGVSLDIRPGETVGLVGESGCGKTTLGRAVLGLAPVTDGSIMFNGRDIARLERRERRELAKDIQVVFQDPYSSLNPSMTVEDILTEPLIVRRVPKAQAVSRVRELLNAVSLPADAAGRRPKAFSGGQRQRIAIARALALDPQLIICDEPVSALDLTTQARVLDLFLEIQQRTGVSYLFISHDIAVIRHVSHRVAVMYQGEIVEFGESDKVTSEPDHVYTQKLLLAAPVPDPDEQAQRRERRQALSGV